MRREPSTADDRLHSARERFYAFLDALDPFKGSSPAERAEFRKALPETDVGYLIALLKALYDEDRFQEWIHFTSYWPRDRGKR